MQLGMPLPTKGCISYIDPMSKKIRLSKLMSERGICSRRDADRYIEKGCVFVDGQLVMQLGMKIAVDASIKLETNEKPLTVLLNKPIGIVSTQPEKSYRAAIELIVPENCVDSRPVFIPYFKRLSCSGRLDIDSKGLLVLTQDGVIAKQLIGNESNIEKEYLVWFAGQINAEKIARLKKGLSLDGKPLKEAKIALLKPHLLKFILKEGKKRQIRRMCEAVNLEVHSLLRVRIGKIKLGNLPEGKWRLLKSQEAF